MKLLIFLSCFLYFLPSYVRFLAANTKRLSLANNLFVVYIGIPRFSFPRQEISVIDPRGYFPGQMLINRTAKIQTLCTEIETTSGLCNHYFRGPRGSGKTMLLQLMGREFEKRGKFVVYYIDNADMLNRFEKSHIDEIVENAKAQGRSTSSFIN